MSEETLMFISLTFSGLTLIGLVALAVFVYRSNLQRTKKQESSLDQFSEDHLENVVTRLSFSESFDPDRFAAASYECALNQVNRSLASNWGDGITVVENSIEFTRSGVEMVVSASREGNKLIEKGTAVVAVHRSGRSLPIVKDVGTGKIIENMKQVKGAKTLSRLSALSSAVVGMAHIVSGADIAKRLKMVDKKVDLLLAYRRIDQVARLERIYTLARELTSGPMNHNKARELWRLRGELQELRCSWRRELQHNLTLIEDPLKASWLSRMFTMQKTMDKTIHDQITEVTEGQLQLGMIEYSMRLDQVLAISGGMINEYEVTLAGELVELQSVSKLLREKAKYISGKYPELDVEPTIKGMDMIVKEYTSLLPEGKVMARNPSQEVEIVESLDNKSEELDDGEES